MGDLFAYGSTQGTDPNVAASLLTCTDRSTTSCFLQEGCFLEAAMWDQNGGGGDCIEWPAPPVYQVAVPKQAQISPSMAEI